MPTSHNKQEADLLRAAGGHQKKGGDSARLLRRITERAIKRADRKPNQPNNKGFA